MEISLKKANELARAALEAAAKVDVPVLASVSVYAKGEPLDFVSQTYEAGSRKFSDAVEASMALMEAGYEIRRLLSEANSVDVNALVTQRAKIEAQDRLLTKVLTAIEAAKDEDGVDEMIGRINHARKIQENAATTRTGFYDSNRNELRVVTDAQVAELRDRQLQLRIRKSETTDTLASMNLTRKITLPAFVVKTLRQHNLIG